MTIATLYLVLMTGEITQLQFSPSTCHILAEHYADGGYFRVWDAKAKREKWLKMDQAICIETVDVASNLPER